MKKGVFIVIDGTDGSGKATQTKLLVARMKREGYAVETITFPQYGKKSAGPLEEYLEGAYGGTDDVDAYQASVLFAVDRFDASRTISAWTSSGSHVIADRYVGSNMGHQGCKIENSDERKTFFAWEMEFEHGLLGIPKPDLNLILHVPTAVTLELTKDRALKGNLENDIHETNEAYLKKAEETYLEIAEQFDQFSVIECVENHHLLSPEAIHEKIWNYVKPYLDRTNS